MAIEFIGSLASGATDLSADPEYPAQMAGLHEESGFDRLLVCHSSSSPDGFAVANQVLTTTSRLGVLLAHRPGFVAPTIAARQYATLDAFHPGRVAMHLSTGGDDADQRRDGDVSDQAARYRRSAEFLDVVKLEWASAEPFDYAGQFYRVSGGRSAVRPSGGRLPVHFAGTSAEAVALGGRHADVYAFGGEPPAAIAGRMAAVRAAVAPHGRSPRFSVSLRPIAAATEQQARARARRILGAGIHDQRPRTPLAATPGPGGNWTALVGSYEQVAGALLDYVAIGVSTLLIRGCDREADAAGYATIITLVRERAARAKVA